MNWSDRDIDELFKDAGRSKPFEYKSEYFKDIEAQLPLRKKKSYFWAYYSLGMAFILLFTTTLFQSPASTSSRKLATMKENEQRSAKNSENSIWLDSTIEPETITAKEADIDQDELDAFQKRQIVQKNRTSTQASDVVVRKAPKKMKPIQHSSMVMHTIALTEEVPIKDLQQLPNKIENTFLNTSNAEVALFQTKKSGAGIFVEGGGHFGQSFIQNDSKNSAQAYGYYLGAGYQYSKNKLRFSAGLGVSQTFYSNIKINERSTVYGFGVNTFDNHYNFTSVLQAHVPVELSYKIKQHEIALGAGVNIPVLATFEHKEIANSETEEKSIGFTMARPLFKAIVPEVNLGYRYNFGHNWSAAAKINAQLINPIASDRFQGESTKIPLNLQVTLRKTFSIHK